MLVEARIDSLEGITRQTPILYRFFRRLDTGAAETLTHETIVLTFESLRHRRPRVSPRAFVIGMARHVLARHRERKKLEPRPARRITPSRLTATLDQLPDDQRLAFELHHWEEFSAAELGEALDLPEDAALARLEAARRAVRKNANVRC